MFKISKDSQNQYRWTLQDAGNHKVILRSSEGYSSKYNAEHSISVCKSCVSFDHFKLRTDSRGQHYFVQFANNGEPIGIGESYHNLSDCQNGINSVVRNAPTAAVVDETSGVKSY